MIQLRSILFVTGTRADFGKLEPLATAARDAGYRVSYFVTGMHMLPAYGLTKVEVHRVKNAVVVEFLNQREGDPQDIIFAKTVIGFSDHLQISSPDLVVVHGDRVEALAAALVCATNYIRCAHIEGGEVSGTIDELFRHCNTKLAYCHLVSSEVARQRVLAMGEADDRVYVIGSPELDAHSSPSGVTLAQVRDRYAIPFEDYAIAVFHPVTSESKEMRQHAEDLFGALVDSKRNFVVIHPNNDPGSRTILDVISKLPKQRFRALPSMRFAYFSELMRNCAAIIGNSSAGVREAPFLGIPSLDVGSRQTKRAASQSIFQTEAADYEAILSFVTNEWGKRYPMSQEFGQGRSGENFVRVLADPSFWDRPFQKYFRDSETGLK